MIDHKIEQAPVHALKPATRNARTHSKRQIEQLAASIERFGFTNPVLVGDDLTIIAGHGRVEAAKLRGMETVPIIKLSHLSEAERRAYVIADNRHAEKAGWDKELLALELADISVLDIELDAIGFEPAELEIILDQAADADPDASDNDEDDVPAVAPTPVSRVGDVWQLGRHRLVCGDAMDEDAYRLLLGDERVDVVFTDPPYNVPIDGFVGGKGKVKPREFAMAAGEMTSPQFQAFLVGTLGCAAAHCSQNAVAFVCMDWRHATELQAAGAQVFHQQLNLCVWVKTNGGMGSLYRSQHELVFVFQVGKGSPCNTVELGKHGRNRTNVWHYAGANAFKAERDEELAMHPTVKPVALIQDALKDVSKRRALVLDPFGGSGSTLIAAERCGRSARLIELDPLYCDVIVRRWQAFTGKAATHGESGETFETMEAHRLSPEPGS